MNDFLQDANLWLHYPLFKIGQSEITLHGISSIIIFLLAIVVMEKLVRRHVLKRLLARTHLDESLRFGIERIVGYTIIVLGF